MSNEEQNIDKPAGCEASELNVLLAGRCGLPRECLKDTYEALRPVFLKYHRMKKGHMNKYRIIGLMYDAFISATKAS